MHFSGRDTRALLFLHIPKTGGTSLVDAMRRSFPKDCCRTDRGNLTPALLQRHADELERESLFHGHAFNGVAALFGPACVATVLRRPAEHAVSNYLYVRREPAVPLHAEARRLGFADFMRKHWEFLVFQTSSLDVALSADSIGCRETLFERLDGIHAFLGRIDHVGCLDRVDEFMGVLAASRRMPHCGTVGRLNAARDQGVDAREAAALAAEYEALREDPDLGALIAVEERLYAQAQCIAARQYAEACHRMQRDAVAFALSV